MTARRALAPVALVGLFTTLIGLPGLGWPANTLDEMILLDYPMRMLNGDLPYRDFFAAYGPAHWWLLEGVVGVAGPSLLALRVVGLAVHVGLTCGLYKLAQPAGRAAALAAGLLGALMLFRLGDAPYAWLTVCGLTVWQIVLLRDRSESARGSVLAGLLAGLALSVRPDALPLIALPVIPLLWRRASARTWCVGLLAGTAPLVVGFLLTPGPFVDDIVLGRAGRGAGQSRLPLIPDNQAVRDLFLILLVTVIVLGINVAVFRSREALVLLLLVLGSAPQAFQRLDLAHLTYAGVVYLPLLPAAISQLVARPRRNLAIAGGVALCLLGTAGSAVYPLLRQLTGDGPRTTVVAHDGRELPLTRSSAATTRQVLALVDANSSPGETLFVFDQDLVRPAVNDVSLYYLLPRLRQRALFVEVTPGVTSEQGSGLKEDVLRADVLVLIDAHESFRRALFPYQRDGSHEAQDAVADHFCVVGRADYYVVYRRC